MTRIDSPPLRSATPAISLPHGFAEAVTANIESILRHQQEDGRICYDPAAPEIYPQQAIFPLAFCYAGLDPQRRFGGDERLAAAIRRLGDFLLGRLNEEGEYHYNSHGYECRIVDQRLTAAWIEATRILRDNGGPFPTTLWEQKILRSCHRLIEQHLRPQLGVRLFNCRTLGTGTNHVALYITTVYRAGHTLDRPEFCALALPIARAFAQSMHPDGYWEEHSDLLHNGGPTPLYNRLSLGAMALMAEWTGEDVFWQAVEKSVDFHCNYDYPDGGSLELLDERVRLSPPPKDCHAPNDRPTMWGLHAFSRSPAGRTSAARKFQRWTSWPGNLENASPETLARHCENYLYWHNGPEEMVPVDRPDHRAMLTLPAGTFRHGPWFIALSCMPATTALDLLYRDNPFALDRQKLFSIWHEAAGVLIDGSHSKNQPENSTFCAQVRGPDCLPRGGTIEVAENRFVARAVYCTFYGSVQIEPVSKTSLRLRFEVEPEGTSGPITAAFTLPRIADALTDANGREFLLGGEPWTLSGDMLGGAFSYASLRLRGPMDMSVSWPLKPFNSYRADHQAPANVWQVRISVALTPQQRMVEFFLDVMPT